MEPTPGFEFPSDQRERIDTALRSVVNNGERTPLQSVRPNRKVGANPVVMPTAPQHQPTPEVERPQPAAQPRFLRSNTVLVPTSPVTPISEPEGISIDLPSRFHYYDFKDLYVKPFRLSHLAKLAAAHATSSMQSVAEVVSSVLSTPQGHQNIAFQLHMADFNAVLYWLRLNSFSKRQMRVRYECTNPAHLHSVEIGEKTKESLQVAALYTNSDLKFVHLDRAPDPEVFKFELENYGTVTMRPETVLDVIDFMDSPEWEDPEFQFKARIASVLDMCSPEGVPARLAQKIAVLDDLPPDVAALATEFADIVDEFGVSEIVQSNCIGCGASAAVRIAVDAQCFLSPEF